MILLKPDVIYTGNEFVINHRPLLDSIHQFTEELGKKRLQLTKTNEADLLTRCDDSERVPAKGCNGHYEINRLGEVFNAKTGRKLRLQLSANGYLWFWDCYHGVQKHKAVHRVSATTFVPNQHGYPEVNHINGIKTDNRPENLEWCTRSHNLKHAYRELGRVPPRQGKPKPEGAGVPPRPVRATHIKTGEQREFESICEAARQVGGDFRNIWSACQGKYKSSAGYKWEYISPTTSKPDNLT